MPRRPCRRSRRSRRRSIRPPRTALLALVLVTMAACASGEPADTGAAPTVASSPPAAATSPPAASEPAASTPAAPAEEVVDVTATVSGGTVQTASPRVEVERGSTVRIRVTSDVPDEVHVHGFGDPVLELAPGTPATLDVVADTDGLYEVETHDSGLLLFQLLVR